MLRVKSPYLTSQKFSSTPHKSPKPLSRQSKKRRNLLHFTQRSYQSSSRSNNYRPSNRPSSFRQTQYDSSSPKRQKPHSQSNQQEQSQQKHDLKPKKFAPPVVSGQSLSLIIEDLTSEGHGVGKVDNYPIFIPNAIPGEEVTISINEIKQSYSTGSVLSWITKSPSRTTPPCEHFTKCGGCQLQHINYEGQLLWKHKMVSGIIKRIGKLNHMPKINPVKGMVDPWHYRNKAQVQIGIDNDSRPVSLITGFYAPRSHDIIDINQCLISSPELTPILNQFTSFLNELGIAPYNEYTHSGLLRHIILRKATSNDETMVILVTLRHQIPHKEEIIQKLQQLIPNLKSVSQNINPDRTNNILGEHSLTLWGAQTITDTIGDIEFKISPSSFYQINPRQTQVLYKQVLAYAERDNKLANSLVVDAYCGVGTIGLYLAKAARHVVGIEVLPDAIENAKSNARASGVSDKTTWHVGKAEDVLQKLYQNGMRPGIVVVDPPRSGLEESLIHTIASRQTPRVIYVSCNPATAARDLQRFEGVGYKVKEIQPVDMFPHTHHVETISLLDFDDFHSPMM